jgi:hypothetical protein
MPRFGKRTQDNEIMAGSVSESEMKIEEERKLLDQFSNTLRLIKLLDKRLNEINT